VHPGLAGNNALDRAFMDAKLAGQSGLAFAILEAIQNLDNIMFGQLADSIGKQNIGASDVIPSLTAAEFANILWNDVVFRGDLGVRKSLIAEVKDFNYLSLRKLGIPVILSVLRLFHWVAVAYTSLCRRISHVVFLSAREQVIRPNAGTNIAFVTHILSIGNWAVVDFVANAMSKANGVIANIELAVSMLHPASRPKPARGAKNWMNGAVFIHLCPKALNDTRGVWRGIMGVHQKITFLVSSLGMVPAIAGAIRVRLYSTNYTRSE
jgi:hypothetical protein